MGGSELQLFLRALTCKSKSLSTTDPFKIMSGGAWVAQLVECPTSAQVMISRSESSSPGLGSVLTAQSLETALDSLSSSLSAPPPHALSLSLSLSLSLKNKIKH